jgi:hypothetical protein
VSAVCAVALCDGKKAVIAATSGKVHLKRMVRIPVWSTVDATAGALSLIADAGDGITS